MVILKWLDFELGKGSTPLFLWYCSIRGEKKENIYSI